MSGRRHERGLALIVVLWVIAALSLIAGAMLATSVNTARINRNAWAQLEVHTAADTAVQTAILSLFDPAGGGPIDGRQRTSSAGNVALTVTVQDQRGLIDLNDAGAAQLRALLRADGIEATLADTITGRIIDRRSQSGTMNDKGDRPAGGRGGPFQSIDELRLVEGMTAELFDRVAPTVTIYSHRGDFDTRTAPRQVLQTIPGMGPEAADSMIAARAEASAGRGHAYAILATAERDRIRFTRRAVVLLTGDPKRPYWILDWN